MNQTPKSDGALFVNNDKQQENHPDYRGHVKVTKEQIDALVRMGQMGLEPTLQIGAWERVGRQSGNRYIFMSTEAYIKQDQQPAPQQQAYQPPPQQGYQQQPQQGYQQQPQQPPAPAPQPQPAPQQPQQWPQQPAPQAPAQPQQQPAPTNNDFTDDDIPF